MNEQRHLSWGAAGTVLVLATLTANTVPAQQLEEITVTARKTTENLQEVPLAITAIGTEEINRLGISGLTQITQQDTSVQFDEGFTPSDTRITIRGLSPTRGRPNAATLVDGIDVTSEAVSNAGGSLLINPRLIDVQRIEIVKGPQSALYGRSAFAGAVQYVTKDPADVLSGDFFFDANSQDAQELRGNVSIPLADNLGMLVNGLVYDARGIYKNKATGDYVGDSDGFGGSVTFKWEPRDNVSLKWRTEYSEDNFGIPPQVLLADFNKFYDLGTSGELERFFGPLTAKEGGNPLYGGSNLAPLSATCEGGPLDNYACQEGRSLRDFYETPGLDARGNPKELGQYDGTDPWLFNQYNKQVVRAFTGKFPDGDDLDIFTMPNYSFGKGARNLANRSYAGLTPQQTRKLFDDYDGIDKDVFRTSLVAEWAYSDSLVFTSYTSYLDAHTTESLDLGKYFVDEGAPDPSLLDPQIRADIIAAGLNIDKFSPINTALGPDGIHDGTNGFAQNSSNDTTQLSQEFRASWDLVDAGALQNITTGVLYWYEDVEQRQLNNTLVTAGAQCFASNGFDNSLDPGLADFLGLDPVRDQCGLTGVSAAFWMADAYQGRVELPDTAKRNTEHWSWYSSVDFDLTDKLSARLEARYTREKNEVTGIVQNPCIDPNAKKGAGGNCFLPDGTLSPDGVGAGGQPSGPSTVILCGQLGRCDRLFTAPDIGATPSFAANVPANTYSWWPWGLQPMPGEDATLDKTDRFWAPKATIEYFWNEDVLTYFSWSRGIKPGGFSLLTEAAFGIDANLDGNFDEIDFDPERLDVWEVGYKSTLFNGRVRLNGSFFYQDFKDKQVTVQAVVGNTVGTKVDNISGSEIYGIELEGTWQVTDNLRASGGWTYLDSEYTDYEVFTTSANDIARVQIGNGKGCQRLATAADAPLEGCLASFNGNKIERVPEHALIGRLNYTNNLFDTGYEWYSEAQWTYQDSRYVEAFNIVEFPSYNITDIRAGILADRWDVTLYVNNLFDDDTIKTGGSSPGVPTGGFNFGLAASPGVFPGVNAGPKLPSDTYAQLPNPRIAGVRVNLRFGE